MQDQVRTCKVTKVILVKIVPINNLSNIQLRLMEYSTVTHLGKGKTTFWPPDVELIILEKLLYPVVGVIIVPQWLSNGLILNPLGGFIVD